MPVNDRNEYEALVGEETDLIRRMQTLEAAQLRFIDLVYTQGDRLHMLALEDVLNAIVCLENEVRVSLSHVCLHKAVMAARSRDKGGDSASCPPRNEN
jgi:hypothetical protein